MTLRKLFKQLDRAADKIEKGALKGFEEGVQVIAADAKRNAAVDTGEHRRKIAVKDGETKYRKRIVAEAPHAVVLEEGNSKQKPQPSVKPAVNKGRYELPERVIKSVNKELK